MTGENDYPSLAQFLSAYFHEDWPDAGSYRDVVRDFVVSEPPELVMQAAAEGSALLAVPLDEKTLAKVLHDLGSYVYTPALELSARDGLQEVVALLGEPGA